MILFSSSWHCRFRLATHGPSSVNQSQHIYVGSPYDSISVHGWDTYGTGDQQESGVAFNIQGQEISCIIPLGLHNFRQKYTSVNK